MASVSMQQVKELRERTQAGLNDCKAALQEAEGEMEKAVELILKKGLAKSAKRAGAVATEGEVAAHVASDGKQGELVEVNIQTDFAARNEDFKRFVQAVVQVAASAPEGADLAAQPHPGGTGSVEDARQALVGRLGENITVRRWGRLALSGSGRVHAYVHMGGKIGALLSVRTGTAEAADAAPLRKFVDDVAMQIAAMAPLYLKAEEIPADARAKQAEIYDAQLREEGKPEGVRAKIVEGKLAKWAKEVCLLEQQSVLESEQTIEQQRAALVKELGTSVELAAFLRYERGEGIEVPQAPDFATEAARMAQGGQ